ncbi:MAG: nucleotidyl transferase AbiEii/AbiGii toxin family protein [Saprospiraceae bacterium]|nr:nucleotidyl transferase AbiEii/AbiGii toxin family protein [Saprospiraceae bacterium]
MAKIDFYTLDKAEKEAIFVAIAAENGMTPFAVEKDWWVSRTLDILFQMEIAKNLVFKGGTSLSKAWKLIHRFSEDIDLAIDREYFFTSEKDWSPKDIKRVRKRASAFSTGIFLNKLKEEFQKRGFKDLVFKVIEANDSDQDPRIIEIFYPNIISLSSDYILPRVQVEIGCRSLKEPLTIRSIGSLVDEVYAGRDFAGPLFDIPTVNPERTFLEKLFLLHEEFHKPAEKVRVDRLSRHLYDIYHLTKVDSVKSAIFDKELYETIVTHRHKFNNVQGVDYNQHNPKMINPIPIQEKMEEWSTDYAKMMEDMIYEEEKPTFEELIENLNDLRNQLQDLEWDFGLVFPEPKHQKQITHNQ